MPIPLESPAARRIESIVAAVDLTHDAEAVVRNAAALAAQTGARLHMVHAVANQGKNVPFLPRRHSARGAHQEAERELEGLAKSADEPARNATRTVLLTSVEAAIMEAETAHWADLIVLGPHYASRRLGHTSTAARIIRHASCPCLCLTGELVLPPRRVLVALALKPHSAGVLDAAFRWVELLGDPAGGVELITLHVTQLGSHFDQSIRPEELIADRITEELVQARARTGLADWVSCGRRVTCNDSVPAAIIDTARKEAADLIVLGTRGPSGPGRVLLGSLVDEVLSTASVPVLLIPPALSDIRAF